MSTKGLYLHLYDDHVESQVTILQKQVRDILILYIYVCSACVMYVEHVYIIVAALHEHCNYFAESTLKLTYKPHALIQTCCLATSSTVFALMAYFTLFGMSTDTTE